MWTKKRIPEPYCSTVRGFFFPFYSGKAPTRLFVVLMVFTVQPFADEMANHASRNSNNKRNDNFHVNTSSRCQVSVGQHMNYITALSIIRFLFSDSFFFDTSSSPRRKIYFKSLTTFPTFLYFSSSVCYGTYGVHIHPQIANGFFMYNSLTNQKLSIGQFAYHNAIILYFLYISYADYLL